jgi:hypothetical protein
LGRVDLRNRFDFQVEIRRVEVVLAGDADRG